MTALDDSTITAVATLFGGSGAAAGFAWLRARRSAPTDTLRHEVRAAKDVNDIAIATLARVSAELHDVTNRLDAVEVAQSASIAELTRVTGLFREALTVLRGVIEAARFGRIPELHLSPQLLNEVAQSGETS